MKTNNNNQAVNTINKVTEEHIGKMLIQLTKECNEWIETTTQLKKHKEDICQYLNISGSVYLSILATYKKLRIEAISKDNKADKALLKSFENVAKLVFKDLQTNPKYSECARIAVKDCKTFEEFILKYCKNYVDGQIITIETIYNIQKGYIIKRYAVDARLTYAKVFSLVCGALDTLKAIRLAGVRDKDWALQKYAIGQIIGVYKFGEVNKATGRPKQGERVTTYTAEDIANAVRFEEL